MATKLCEAWPNPSPLLPTHTPVLASPVSLGFLEGAKLSHLPLSKHLGLDASPETPVLAITSLSSPEAGLPGLKLHNHGCAV